MCSLKGERIFIVQLCVLGELGKPMEAEMQSLHFQCSKGNITTARKHTAGDL